jgi:hypothetical protein
MKTLREFLEEKARIPGQEERRQRREEWVACVQRIMQQFSDWLAEADTLGVLEIVPLDLERIEQGLGNYRVPGWSIQFEDTVIKILPVGRNVLGFLGPETEKPLRPQGRIDVTDGARRFILYRVLQDDGEQWLVVDDKYRVTPLDRQRFEAMIQELLS